MKIVQSLLDWTSNTFGSWGIYGLLGLAFTEASFFPIPVEFLLIPFVLADISSWWIYWLVAWWGSVAGGLFGYYIGYFGKEAVLKKLFSERKIHKVHNQFDKHGGWAVFIGGFTPIPYKIFTIAAGVFYINLKTFLVASIISRGLRFGLITFLIYLTGEWMVNFIDTYFNLITIIVSGFVVLGYFWHRRKKNRKKIFRN